MWQGEKGDDGTIVTGRQGRRAARCGGASQGKRAMVRHSMSAGVLLTTIRSPPRHPPRPLADNLLELFRGGNLAGASSSWASRATPPPVAIRFLLLWLSLDGAIRF